MSHFVASVHVHGRRCPFFRRRGFAFALVGLCTFNEQLLLNLYGFVVGEDFFISWGASFALSLSLTADNEKKSECKSRIAHNINIRIRRLAFAITALLLLLGRFPANTEERMHTM